jgi:RNA polymerase sigma factor (sigma-70 family)
MAAFTKTVKLGWRANPIIRLMHNCQENNSCKYSPAFVALYDRLYSPLFWFTFKMLGHQEDAEDLVADVFSKLWMKRDQIDLIANIEGYLKKSMVNACLDFMRRSKLKDKVKEELTYRLRQECEEGYVRAQIKAEVLDFVNLEMKRLPAKYASIFNLSFMEGLTNEEIADELNLTNQGVRNIKAKIRKGLKFTIIVGLMLFQTCMVSLANA